MAKETFDGSSYSVWQIVAAANSYYELSTIFTSQIPKAGESPPGRDDLGVASATNRILALELYMKAALIKVNIPVPKDHDLKELFDAMPEQMRTNVETIYNKEMTDRVSQGGLASFSIYFQLGSELTLEKLKQKKNKPVRIDESISALLVRNRKGFVMSRYLFQEAKLERHTHFLYEYVGLAVLCKILCEGLESRMPKTQPYKRHFEF
jgi:hypothetical protein